MFEHHCAELDTGMLSNINLLKGKVYSYKYFAKWKLWLSSENNNA